MNKTKLLSTMGVGIAGPLLFAIVFGLLTWFGAHNLKGYGLATTRERWVYLMLPPRARFSFCWASMVTLSDASSCLGVWYFLGLICVSVFCMIPLSLDVFQELDERIMDYGQDPRGV
jgi:hypothetical protein